MAGIRPLTGSRPAVLALLAAAIASAAALCVLTALLPSPFPTKAYNSPFVLALAAVLDSSVGAAILLRHPRNAVGWIFLGSGTGFAIAGLSGWYRWYALIERNGVIPGGDWASWINSWAWLPTVVTPLTLLFLIFPNGTLPSARWRPVAWYTVLLIAGGTLASALVPGGLPGSQPTLAVFVVLFVLAIVPCVSALVVRFRRSRGVERQQIKWLAYAGALLPLGQLLTSGLVIEAAPLQVLGLLTAFAVPVATGVAILRYRLYDIDLIIHRTLVYGVTSAAIAATFYLSVAALQPLMGALTAGNEIAVAASTLLSFAVFQPVRRRVQEAVDRRFHRSRYDAARTLEVFSDRLRDEVDLDALRTDLLGAVRQTMGPAHASLWLRK